MSAIPRSADMLVNLLLSRPGELEKLKQNPEKTLRDLAAETTQTLIPPVTKREVGLYYIVVSALAFVAVVAVCGSIYLTVTMAPNGTVQIPDVMTALGSAAIGALAGLLAPSPKE